MAKKKIEKNNSVIALNVLYSKNEKIYPAYVSKHNSNNLFFNDSRQITITFYCSKKAIGIT